MKTIKKIIILYYSILTHLKLVPTKRVLILSHMRSGSSLLSHILFGNKEISGIGETGNRYADKKYHLKLVSSILLRRKALFFKNNPSYVMDKVLHADFITDNSILEDTKTYIILLIREPEEAIPSILNTYENERGWHYKNAYNYYIDRLHFIEYNLINFSKRVFFVDYSDFLVNHKDILHNLTSFLKLKRGLKSTYKSIEFTGKRGTGDWSKNIYSGEILNKKEKKKSYSELKDFDKQLLIEAHLLYDKVKSLGISVNYHNNN